MIGDSKVHETPSSESALTSPLAESRYIRSRPSEVGTTASASGAPTPKLPSVSDSDVHDHPSSLETALEVWVPDPRRVQTSRSSLPPKYMRRLPSGSRTTEMWLIGWLPPQRSNLG